MAFTAVLRRSASNAVPFATRIIGGQRYSHHCAALFSAANHIRKFTPSNYTSFPSISHFSSSASTALKRPSSDDSLLKVIQAEIVCAEETVDNEVEEVPENFPFEIKDNPGLQTVTLFREYQGENIIVEVGQSTLTTGEDDGDEDDQNDDDTEKGGHSSIPLDVRVSKENGPCLEFGVTAYPDEIVIDSLSYKDPDAPEDQLPYMGPTFEDLDENLQKAFHKYLEIRGIKPSTTNFLHEYMVNKEHKEYTSWLKNLKKFIEA